MMGIFTYFMNIDELLDILSLVKLDMFLRKKIKILILRVFAQRHVGPGSCGWIVAIF